MDALRRERRARQQKIIDSHTPLEERRSEAVIEKLAMMNSFKAEVMLTKPSEQQPSGSLMTWVRRYLTDEDGAVARGQALTQLLWLPPHQRVAVIEYLKGEGSYAQNGPGFVVTLKNASAAEIKVEHVYTWRSVPVEHQGIGFVDGPTGYGQRGVRMLRPGESINLTPHFAIMNLQRHCLSAHDPVRWGENASIPQRDFLVETGYRCLTLSDASGDPIDSDALRRRAEAAENESPKSLAPRRRADAA